MSDAASRPALCALAEDVGILPRYADTTGRVREPTDVTREAILDAMGMDASTEGGAREALRERRRRARATVIDPVCVAGADRAGGLSMFLAEACAGARLDYMLDVSLEDGRSVRETGQVALDLRRRGTIALGSLPQGYHRIRLSLSGPGAPEGALHQVHVRVPSRCIHPREVLSGGRGLGIICNLYTVGLPGDDGHGDLRHLRELLDWSRELGFDFLGTNPLHALAPDGRQASPYFPTSRLFDDPLYIDPARVPEVDGAVPKRSAPRDPPGALIDYSRARADRMAELERSYVRFREGGRDTPRARAFREYAESGGAALTDFATFCALAETYSGDWRRWPVHLRSHRAEAVTRWRHEASDRVDFYRWLQFELDRQLGEASAQALSGGVRLGLYRDLALGSAPGGADTWAFPGLFLEGVSLGAPPDTFAAEGQDWGLPPLSAERLRADGYRYWIDLLRAGMRRAGVLRLDHVMGLFRQYWVPRGHSSRDGAYVRWPAGELLGILALESRRAGTVCVGEDLGTVPAVVEPALRRRGVLSTRVLYFERDSDGSFRAAGRYPGEALAVANTHDMVPLAGWARGRDVELRADLARAQGQPIPPDRDPQRDLDRLTEVVSWNGKAEDLRRSVHRFLADTRCSLVGLSLDDMAAEEDPVNLPDATADHYPSWRRRMRRHLKDLRGDERLRGELRELRRPSAARGVGPLTPPRRGP